MQILQLVMVILFFVCCGVLVFLIMIQSGKGGSLGIFGGAGSSTAFGSSTVDVVTKATWYGAAAFFILAILSAIAFADLGPQAPINPTKGAGTPAGTKGAPGKEAKDGPKGMGQDQAPKGNTPAPAGKTQ